MNPDTCCVTKRNNRHPFQVAEKCIQTACLPHERNSCRRPDGEHAAADTSGHQEDTGPSAGEIAAGFRDTDPPSSHAATSQPVRLIRRNLPALPHVAAQNGFDRGSAGLRTGNGGKTGKEGGNSGQSAGFGEDSRRARDAKCPQRRFDGGGCDGKGPLFVLYPSKNSCADRGAHTERQRRPEPDRLTRQGQWFLPVGATGAPRCAPVGQNLPAQDHKTLRAVLADQ